MSEDKTMPSGWCDVRLEDLVLNPKSDLVDGPFGSNLKSSEYIDSGIPVLKIQNIKANRFVRKRLSYVSPKKAAELSRHSFVAGDLMITKLGEPLGLCCEVPADLEHGVFVADLMRLRPSSMIVRSAFLLHAINSVVVQSQFKEITKGTTRQRVNLSIVRGIKLALPPLTEQKRIVEKLEELLSELDAGVTNLKKARAQLAVYRQALLKHAFEGHLTAKWRAAHTPELESAEQLLARIRAERQKHAEHINRKKCQAPIAPDTTGLPDLPETWQWASLDQVFIVERGRFSVRPRNDPRYFGGDMPFVQIGDLPREGGSIKSYHQTLNEDGVGVSKAFPPGTVLIAIVGATIGNTGILSFESCCPDSLVALQSHSPVLLRYADAFIQSRKLSLRAVASASGGQPNINLNLLQPMAIPLPPEKEVEAVLDALESQLTNITALEADIDQNIQRAEALRQSILKKAFAGELVPQAPADEPAAALLARIRAEREAQAAAPKISKIRTKKA